MHIIISGGGSAGAYARGILEYIWKHHPEIQFEGGSGTSVGSLVLLPTMFGDYEGLCRFWDSVADHPEKVYKKKFLGYANLLWSDSIYDSQPLLGMIFDYLKDKKIEQIKGWWRYYYVELTDTQLYFAWHTHSNLAKCILASASMPGFFPAVHIDVDYPRSVDAGLRAVTPVDWVVNEEPAPKELLIIQCSTGESQRQEAKKLDKGLPVLLRSVSTLIDEVYEDDLTPFMIINEAVRQAKEDGQEFLRPNGVPYKYIKSVVLKQKRRYGDTLSFKKADLEQMAQNGWYEAKALWG